MNEKGFTLIELMLVVSTIGILAAIAIPAYNDYVQRAKYAEPLTLAEPLKDALVKYYERWGEFPSSTQQAGLGDLSGYRGEYTESISIQEGIIELIVGTSADTHRLWLQAALPDVSGPKNTVLWLCMPSKDIEGLIRVGNYQPVRDDVPAAPVNYLPWDCRL